MTINFSVDVKLIIALGIFTFLVYLTRIIYNYLHYEQKNNTYNVLKIEHDSTTLSNKEIDKKLEEF